MEQTQLACGKSTDSKYFKEKVTHIYGWRKQMVSVRCQWAALSRLTGTLSFIIAYLLLVGTKAYYFQVR